MRSPSWWGGEAYVGTGDNGSTYKKDLWKYNPATDSWTQLNDFPANFEARYGAVSFVVGGEAFVGTGLAVSAYKKDLWKYNPATDSWAQFNDFPANFDARFRAVSFVVGGEAYVGTGYNDSTYKKDLWKYNPATDSWTPLNDFPANFDARVYAVSFVLDEVAYVGTGLNINFSNKKDLWKYRNNPPYLMTVNNIGEAAWVDLSTINDYQTISKTGSTVTLSNGGGSFTDAVDDADASPTNELQTISKTGSTVTLSNGGGSFTDAVDDADASPTNELITSATLNGNNLQITDAGGTKTVDLSSLNPAETDPQVGANTTNYLSKWNGSALVSSISLSENGSGLVGLGTTNPKLLFHISGANSGLNILPTYGTGMVITGHASRPRIYFEDTQASTNQKVMLMEMKDGVLTWRSTNDGGTATQVSDILNLKTNGNIGIGTPSPVNKLDVEGGMAIGASYSGTSTAPADGVIIEGKVGIGTNNPGAKLSISPGATEQKISLWTNGADDYGFGISSAQLNYHVGNTASRHVFYAGGNNGNGTELMRIQGDGNVGIGTDNPLTRLDVSGGTRTSSLTTASIGVHDNGVNNHTIAFNGGTTGDKWINFRLGGNPTGNAGVIFSDHGSEHNFLYNNGTSLEFKYSTQSSDDPSVSLATTRLSIRNSDGYVGIGTSSPSEKLHVVGNICATGTIASCSDVRFKKDFQPIAGALGKIQQLNGLYYFWKKEEFPDRDFNDKRQIGLIAQEVEGLFPEMVLTDPKGYKSVDYSRLTPVLVEAVKEQQVQIDNLKKSNMEQRTEIENLRSQLTEMDDLKQRLARLEAALLPSNPTSQNSTTK